MLIIIASSRHFCRRPGEPGFDPIGRLYGIFAYAYYFTRSQWTGNREGNPAARRAAARAAWHRPEMTRQLLRIAPDDYPELAREYASLGLGKQAAEFFRRAFPDALREEDRALEIISYLAILGDWWGAGDFSQRVLEVDRESFEANYWRGRSLVETGNFTEASPFLAKAYALNPSAVDAIYQPGQAYEEAGGKNLSFENRFVLLGYSTDRNEISTGDSITIDVYLQGWRFQPAEIQPELLFSDRIGGKARVVLPAVETGNPGEVTRESLTCRVPEHLAPGPIQVMLSFRDPGNQRQVGLNTTAENHVAIAELNLHPGWIASSISDNLIRRRFGPRAKALGKKTFLAEGSLQILDFSGDVTVSGLGIVSGVICPTRNRNSLFQGRAIAQITAEAEDGRRVSFPLVLGRDTADIHWDLPGASVPRHEKAPIFNSRTAKWREPHFPAHQYYAFYQLPEPLKLKSLRIEGRGDGLVLQISDLILITD